MGKVLDKQRGGKGNEQRKSRGSKVQEKFGATHQLYFSSAGSVRGSGDEHNKGGFNEEGRHVEKGGGSREEERRDHENERKVRCAHGRQW